MIGNFVATGIPEELLRFNGVPDNGTVVLNGVTRVVREGMLVPLGTGARGETKIILNEPIPDRDGGPVQYKQTIVATLSEKKEKESNA